MSIYIDIRKKDAFIAFLQTKGFEVNSIQVGYRQLMFRKDNTMWSQAYGNDIGLSLKVSGPERNIAKEFNKGK